MHCRHYPQSQRGVPASSPCLLEKSTDGDHSCGMCDGRCGHWAPCSRHELSQQVSSSGAPAICFRHKQGARGSQFRSVTTGKSRRLGLQAGCDYSLLSGSIANRPRGVAHLILLDDFKTRALHLRGGQVFSRPRHNTCVRPCEVRDLEQTMRAVRAYVWVCLMAQGTHSTLKVAKRGSPSRQPLTPALWLPIRPVCEAP